MFVSKPVTISARRQALLRPQLRGLEPRADRPDARRRSYSDNTVYAQLTRIVEPKNVVETAHELGITSPLQGYFSIALGGEAVNPLEMARAYATFANGGKRIDGSIIGEPPAGDRLA